MRKPERGNCKDSLAMDLANREVLCLEGGDFRADSGLADFD